MIESILQIIVENKENLEKSFTESVENNEITMFSRKLKEVLDKAGKEGVINAIQTVEEAFFKSEKRKKEYEIKEKNKKQLLTEFGNIEFTIRYYQNKKTKEYIHLATEKLGIEKYSRIDTSVESRIIEFSNDISYSKAGKKVVNNERLSKTTVMKKVRKTELKKEGNIENKISKKILYIEADEDHVSTVGDKISMPKLVYVHEGRISHGKRNILKNVHYIGCLGKNSEEVWLEVAEYMDKRYDSEEIETVYLSGDGAGWIKEGLNWIKNSKFVLDKFHLLKYINKATMEHKEYRNKIWYNINIGDNISVENIFKELIEITEKENKKEIIIESWKYIKNQWDGIEIYQTDTNNIIGCSAEGHISHVFADRMSSRPRTWSEDGVNKMSRLRAFTANKGNVYEELVKIKKLDTKLKKYDKVVARNIKTRVPNGDTVTKLPIIEIGKATGKRIALEKLLYG
jgi:hypothetical protein